MRGLLAVIAFALFGLFGAASIGYAAYVVSRDSVGLPVTKLQPARKAHGLAPPAARKTIISRTRATPTRPVTSPRTKSVDDHGGERPRTGEDNSGKGSEGGSDHSGNRGGGDDD